MFKKSSRIEQLRDFVKEAKPVETHETKIFKALKKAGRHGLWNYELANVCIDWHRRIGDLRSSGINIRPERQKDGGWKYYLETE